MKRLVLAVWLLLPLAPALAHEVHLAVEAASAVSVRLTFADGQPFAFEAFEVYAAGADKPSAVSRTDAQGRAVFLPPATGEVRLRAFAADGHGVDLKLNPPRGGEAAVAAATEDRALKIILGVGILLALFGLVQLVLRRKKHA
ncbi:MAG: ABC transporter permease [Betaproteobacteria bacterium HGW-Betaproteobacteria-14]|nr:MAG: ABC transporter permease [Betaproteobacteria bacterium HGW-Betaproteobacteria-14]